MPASCSMEAPTPESFCCVELAWRTPEDPYFPSGLSTKNRTSTELDTKLNAKDARTCRLQSSSTSLSHLSPLCMLQSAHQSRGTERKELSFPRVQQASDASR